MKKIIFIATVYFVISKSSFSQCSVLLTTPESSPLSQTTYNLIFSDEFSGSALNSFWHKSTGLLRDQICSAGNANNVTVANGILQLRADDVDYAGFQYSCGEIVSYVWDDPNAQMRFNTNSYFEVRAKVESGQDSYPAIWLWDCYPLWEEIDFAEFETSTYEYRTNNIYGSIQSPCTDPSSNECFVSEYPNAFLPSIDLSLDYHIYGLEWKGSTAKFYLDNRLARTITTNLPLTPMAFILSQQILGNPCYAWPFNPAPDLPRNLNVDYVRVYNTNNTAVWLAFSPLQLSNGNFEVCKGVSSSFGVGPYVSSTYLWTSNQFTFTTPNSNSTGIVSNSSTLINQLNTCTLTVTFPSGYVEQKIYNVFVSDGAPAMPGTISKVRIGTTCYYNARVTADPYVSIYEWKLGSGAWVAGVPSGSYNLYPDELDPNTTYSFQVRAKYVCNIASAVKSGTITIGNPPPGCTWKESNEILPTSGFTIYPNPATDQIILRGINTSDETCIVNIRNQFGIKFREIKIENSKIDNSIDVSDLPQGCYFIMIQSGGISSVKLLSIIR